MRIEYTTRIEIAEPATEISPAMQARMLDFFNRAIEREIMAVFAATAPAAGTVTIDTIRPRPVRSSLGFLDYTAVT